MVERFFKNGTPFPMWRPERILKPQPSRAAGEDRIQAMTTRLSPMGDGTCKTVYIHHLVLLAFVGPKPKGLVGCHNDGDVTNNKSSNLRWDTYTSNSLDAVRHGTAFKPNLECGEHCPGSKLSNKQIIEIIDSPWDTRGIGSGFAKRFGVCNSAIYEVRRRYARRPDLLKRIRSSACLTLPATY